MKRSPIVLLILSAIFSTVSAQQLVTPPTRGYHALTYQVMLDWRPVFQKQSAKYSGYNHITLRADTMLTSIVLDASQMSIDSIVTNQGQIKPVPQPVADTLTILLSNPLHVGQDQELVIYFTHTNVNEQGLYYYPKNLYVGKSQAGDSVFTAEDVAYTMSEPLDAHKWMPCNDEPYNKVNASISIIVPKGYSAQSNGFLSSIDTNRQDQSHTYNWTSDKPIASYLMVANASVWTTWQDYYHRLTNPTDSVPVIYYAWPVDYSPEDTSVAVYNAKHTFRNTPKMLEVYSRLFGEYPFGSYSQVPVQPFNFGGMEHQTITTLTRRVLRGDEEDVIAHELMHQWFGDKVTCETWADIWLNEGFATMGEWLWEEAAYGKDAHDAVLQQQVQRFFAPNTQFGQTNTIPVYDPPIANVFNDPTTYLKPGCMLHMLRRALDDDSLFFSTLREYNDAFAYSTANTFQFRDFLAQHAGARAPIDLATFVNEWIFQPDWPLYKMRWHQRADNTLIVRVDQTQDSTDHYTMPLRFFAIAGSDTTQLMFVNDQRSQYFAAHLDHPVTRLVFDRDAAILSQPTLSQDASLDDVLAAPPTGHYLRAQSDGTLMKLTFEPAVGSSARLELLDLLGRVLQSSAVVQGATMKLMQAVPVATGSYFIRLVDGSSQQMTRVQLQR